MRPLIKLTHILAWVLLASSSAVNARPFIDINNIADVDLSDDGTGGTIDKSGRYHCEWGCGSHEGPDGNGYGNGPEKGPRTIEVPSRETESTKGPKYGGSDGDRGIFGGFDRSSKQKDETEVWQEYRALVAQVNSKWTADLAKQFQEDQTKFTDISERTDRALNTEVPRILHYAERARDLTSVIERNIPEQFEGYQYSINDRSALQPYLDYPYQSAHKDSLEAIRESYKSFKPNSPQSYNAYKSGLKALKEADDAYSEEHINLGGFLEEASKILFDIATDINPVTGAFKDLYRSFVGKDPLTGAKLSSLERGFSAVFAVAGIATLGGSNVFKVTAAEIAKIAGSTYKEARLSEELVKVINRASTKIHVMLPGTSGKYTLIGQGMGRVHELKNALKEEGIVIQTFKASDEAEVTWNKLFPKYSNDVPDLIVESTLVYKENMAWIRSQIQEGNTILGLEDLARYSTFWEMEKKVILEHVKGIR